MAQRIRRSRAKGWRMPGGAVYVGRPTFWGNPYSLTKAPPMWPKNKPWTRLEAAKRYELMLAGGHGLRRPPGFQIVERAMKELEGRDLACWCPLDGPCHADVLLRYANGNRDGVLLPSERPDE